MKKQKEIKETIPFTIATKRIKYLGINLPKETKDLYTENYKTLMNDIIFLRCLFKTTQIGRDIYHVIGLEESIQ